MTEKGVSENIFVGVYSTREVEQYVIRNPVTGQGWALPVEDIVPENLRILTERIESNRGEVSDDC